MSQRIRGVLAPVVTPFKADLSPDCERFIRHCQWLLSQDCGLAVFGTNSEANSMAAKERSTLLDVLVAAGIDPSRMMPGTGCCSVTETVELTARAVKPGCGGVGTISATANVNPAAIHKLYRQWNTAGDADQQQSKLNVVREVFSSRKFPSMIAALKQAIAIYRNDPEWIRMRPPLVELTKEQAKLLAAELKAIGFAMPNIA